LGGRSKPQITETMDSLSVNMGAQLYMDNWPPVLAIFMLARLLVAVICASVLRWHSICCDTWILYYLCSETKYMFVVLLSCHMCHLLQCPVTFQWMQLMVGRKLAVSFCFSVCDTRMSSRFIISNIFSPESMIRWLMFIYCHMNRYMRSSFIKITLFSSSRLVVWWILPKV
jgi:hypothetical protein